MNSTDDRKRITQELTAAGMSPVVLRKMRTRYLLTLIEPDEHVKGIIYGVCTNGLGMLAATDKRIIYVERRPGFKSSDDIAYHAVHGVHHNTAGLFAAVTLQTWVGEYTLRFVNRQCAHNFTQYIDQKLEEQPNPNALNNAVAPAAQQPTNIPPEAQVFLAQHNTGVLSTSDRTGNIDNAVIYYWLSPDDALYFVTKSDTAKAQNIRANQMIALTVYDAAQMKTATIKGAAAIETDVRMRQYVFETLVHDNAPVAQLDAGGYVPFKITPTEVNYQDYQRQAQTTPTGPA